jgi:peptidoglycan-N-acetylglucosamine deacetylase
MVARQLIPVPVLGIALAGAMGIPATDATGLTPAATPAASSTSAASESVPARQKRGVPQSVAIQEGPSDRKRVALTFDADMTPDMRQRLESGEVRTWYNENVIDVLRRTGTPATLFLTGLWAQTYPEVAESLGDDPLFEIANHSLEHKAFSPCYTLPVLREEEKLAAVSESEQVIEQITGERPYYFRFPGGSIKCAHQRDVALVAALGEQAVDWTAAGDAFQPDPQVVVDSVMANIRPGAIVALHMHGSDETPNAPATDEAIALLIPKLQSQGYKLVTLGQLLEQ